MSAVSAERVDFVSARVARRFLKCGAALSFWVAFISRALIAQDAPAIEKLAQQLASRDRDTRREAAYQLNQLGAAARPALPALITALEDQDKQVWSDAIGAVTALGPDAKDAIPALIESLNDNTARGGRERDRRQMMMRSAVALARIGPAAVPPLIEALRSHEASVRAGAARALGGMGAGARAAIPALVKNLGDGDENARAADIEALGSLGADARPALLASLADQDARRRAGAVLALGAEEIGDANVAGALLGRAEKETDPLVRLALLTALPKCGAEAARMLPVLLSGVKDEREELRHAAINAIGGNRALRKSAVAPLSALLGGSERARAAARGACAEPAHARIERGAARFDESDEGCRRRSRIRR